MAVDNTLWMSSYCTTEIQLLNIHGVLVRFNSGQL